MWHVTQDADRFVGVVDFGWGTVDPKWSVFDMSQDRDMARRWADRQMELPVGSNEVPSPPPPVGGLVDDAFWTQLKRECPNAVDLRSVLPTRPDGPNGPFLTRPLSRVKWTAWHHSVSRKNTTPKQIAESHIQSRASGGRLEAAGIG